MIQTTNGESGSNNQHEVYAVFRVFNLGTESTGLRITWTQKNSEKAESSGLRRP